MIFRKPYAFLIKHFQKINFLLFLLSTYVLFRNLAFQDMVRNYLDTKYYNPIATPMSEYTSFLFFTCIVAIFAICLVLIFLLYYKKKPVVVYGLILLEYFLVMITFIYASSYFNHIGFDAINLQQTLLIRDFLFIVSIPQYAILVILLVRFLGLDLKKFGFREDEEYLDINEEDREEVEVSVGLDPYQVKRVVKNRFRRIKYVVLEHQGICLTIALVLFLGGSYFLYHQIFVENRTYKMGQTFRANSYELKINKMYFTDKDYAGNVINQEGRKYIILDLSIKNVTNQNLTLDTKKFIITANHNYYVPIQSHDQYFTDLGKGYQNQTLAPGVTNSMLLIYEIKPIDFGSKYTLYYQEIRGSNDLKLRLIHTNLTDLSSSTETSLAYLNTAMDLEFYDTTKKTVSFYNYQVMDEASYLYTSCYVWDCKVYEGKIKASNYSGNKSILRLNFSEDTTGLSLSSFLAKQAKLVYTIDQVKKESTFSLPLSRDWKGKYVYLLVPKEVMNATDVAFKFVVRDKTYEYFLKGGNENATSGS